jgi:DUF1365 family protein
MTAAALAPDGPALYAASVMHRRCIAPRYRFAYRLFYLWLDVDRLERTAAGSRWFSYNRFNLLSFYDRDHGDGHSTPRAFAEGVLARAGLRLAGGRIWLLTLPRVLGYVFNPVSFWFCEDDERRLRAVIAEVNNTFGERHCYLLASEDQCLAYPLTMDKAKCFHVSPFLPVSGDYRFRIARPGARLAIAIRHGQAGQTQLQAALVGERRPFSDAAILKLCLAMPLATLKTIAAIHWQALKLWLRGARYYRKPPRPDFEVS